VEHFVRAFETGACSNGRDEGEVVEKIENSDIIVPKKG